MSARVNGATEMSEHVSRSARASCEDLVVRFFHALDRRDYDTVGALFSRDGVWRRQGVVLTGATTIADTLRRRPADLETRHLLSNVLIGLAGETAVVDYDVAVYARQGSEPARLAQILSGQDRLARVDGEWRFASKQASTVFSFAG